MSLPGDTPFCPYCGNQTIESTSVRTYCYTCGEDIVTAGQVAELEDDAEVNFARIKELTDENHAWQQQIAALAVTP